MRPIRNWTILTGVLVFALSGSLIAAEKKVADAPIARATIPQQELQPRPIPMGVSIGNTPSLPFIYAGTAGLLVRSLANPSQKFILSNNHVLGARGPSLCPNTAISGQTRTLQPGTLDIGSDPGGNNPTYLAGLVAGFWPLNTGALNLIDAALSITTPALAKSEILEIGVPTGALGIAAPGMPVTKGGRTTGVTTGTVDSVNAAILVGYGEGCSSYFFIGQTIITPGSFSAGGDSGSAILETATKTPVGLLFAGSNQFTVANQIFWAYALLGVFVDTAPGGSAPASVDELTRGQGSMEAKMDPRIARATQIQSLHQSQILSIPGVHGIGVGLDGSDMVFKVYGTRLTSAISSALPQQLEGVRVVFRESGSAFTAR